MKNKIYGLNLENKYGLCKKCKTPLKYEGDNCLGVEYYIKCPKCGLIRDYYNAGYMEIDNYKDMTCHPFIERLKLFFKNIITRKRNKKNNKLWIKEEDDLPF
jgi:hypothetical protein